MAGLCIKTAFLKPHLAARTFQLSMIHVRHLQTGPKGTYIAKEEPAIVNLVAEKKYAWCLCGLSKKQPFCDGSHKTTEFKPVRFVLKENKDNVALCQCKQTDNRPYCDGTTCLYYQVLPKIY